VTTRQLKTEQSFMIFNISALGISLFLVVLAPHRTPEPIIKKKLKF